jgi:predicted nucleic acid-binding protein
MKLVLDSSIAVKWVIAEADTPKAVQLRDAMRNGLRELIAPDVFPIEVAHAIAKAERQGRIGVGDGVPFVGDVLTTLPILHAALPLLPRAFVIASTARIGVYDCLYVALAERNSATPLRRRPSDSALQASFPFIISLASAP